MATSSPASAAMSASSFPRIPTWLGIQQKVINLPLLVSWLWSFRIFKISGFSTSHLSIACKLDKESERTTQSLLLARRMMSSAMSIAWISAVKILALSGKRIVLTELGATTAAAVRPYIKSTLWLSVSDCSLFIISVTESAMWCNNFMVWNILR